MGIIEFVGCFHQRQNLTVQRLGTPTDDSAMLMTCDSNISMIPNGSYSRGVCDIPPEMCFLEAVMPKLSGSPSEWSENCHRRLVKSGLHGRAVRLDSR